ncbi:MAG: helix-turn-helix transcriptional regulator [Asgard group archaeon]|nr:helix-turn-helix transcriptional regulator [Asgard group archaeon]
MPKKSKSNEILSNTDLDVLTHSEEEEIIYNALGSPVRREIIHFIKIHERVGFLDLQKKFDLKVGSLYHQLNSMQDLWDQDENKKYYLTQLGEVAYNLIILNRDQIEIANVKTIKIDSMDQKVTFWQKLKHALIAVFLPRKIFKYLASEPLRTFFEGLIIIGGLIYFSIDSGVVLIGFYPLEVDFWYLSLIGILGTWLILGLVTVGFKAIIYKREYNPLKFLAILPFTLIPSLLVLFLIWLQTMVETAFLFLDGQILIILSQVWTLPLMTTAISQTEELTMNRSSLVALFSFYLTYVVAFVLFGIQ